MVSEKLIYIVLAIVVFVENADAGYTYARAPWAFCEKLESPPKYIIILNNNGTMIVYLNQQYSEPSDPLMHGLHPITYHFF